MYRFGVLFFHQNPSTRKNQVCSRCFNDTHCGRLCDIVNMNSSWPHQIAWATHAVTSVWRSLLLFQRVRWKCRLIHRNRVVYFEGFYNAQKTTEGRTIRHCRSSPFSQRERCLLDPVVIPPNTRLVASQTRLDRSRTNLCRRPCRVNFARNANRTHQTPCRDTCRDVAGAVLERLNGLRA